jgi:hypothetical protein
MPAGEGSEADRSEGRPKRQKEKREGRGGKGAGRRIRQRSTRLARPRVDAHIGVRPSREIRLEEEGESEQ